MVEVRVFAVVRDEDGRLLCVQRAHEPRDWTLPGGKLEKGESPFDALQREVREESGCVVDPADLVGVYATPEDDDLALLFDARLVSRSSGRPDDEIARAEFRDVDALPEPFSEHARIRVGDALAKARGVVRVLAPKARSLGDAGEARTASATPRGPAR